MEIIAETVLAKDLRPGDLFSSEVDTHWANLDPACIGEKVYIRTAAPCPPGQANIEVGRITIKGGAALEAGAVAGLVAALEAMVSEASDTQISCLICGQGGTHVAGCPVVGAQAALKLVRGEE